jgi:hypothetical protein
MSNSGADDSDANLRRFDRGDRGWSGRCLHAGKTISSNFDPWEAPTFREDLTDIVRSDLYTLRRINIVNLPDGRLRETLARPWAETKHA